MPSTASRRNIASRSSAPVMAVVFGAEVGSVRDTTLNYCNMQFMSRAMVAFHAFAALLPARREKT